MIRDFFVQEANVEVGDNLDTGYFVVLRQGVRIGDDVKIWSNTVVDSNAKIGNRVRMHCNNYISQGVIVEDDVFIGPGCQILNDKYPVRTDPNLWQPPRLKRGAVIGGGVTICPNVTIGCGAVIGAGSVVTKDVPDRQIWVGNPAKHIATLPPAKDNNGT